MPQGEKEQTCFVIAPIGEEGSDIRSRSDQVLNHIIAPAAKECGYTAVRADKIAEPGIITSQVIQHVVEDGLVIADLTGRNPNVYYELAVRHAVKKAVVQIIEVGESPPFDVAGTRTIPVDHHDLDSAEQCRDELMRQIRSVERDPTQVASPISVAIDLQSLRQSDNPLEKSYGDIISMLQELRVAVGELSNGSLGRSRIHPGIIEELFAMFLRLDNILTLGPQDEPIRAQVDEASSLLRRSLRIVEQLALESGMPRKMVEEMFFRRRRLADRD